MRTKPKAIKIAWFEKCFLGEPVLIGDNKQGAGAVFLVVVVFIVFFVRIIWWLSIKQALVLSKGRDLEISIIE